MAWLTVHEAAHLLRVPVSWLYERTRTNRVPHVKLGKYLRFDRDKLAAWVDEQQQDGGGLGATRRPIGRCSGPSNVDFSSRSGYRLLRIAPTDQRVPAWPPRGKEGSELGAIRKRGKHYAIQSTTMRRAGGRWETIGPNLHEARQVLAERHVGASQREVPPQQGEPITVKGSSPRSGTRTRA